MSGPFTREDMVDAIATAISDSMDVDWTSRTGAEAVVSNCGVFELYEAGEDAAKELESLLGRVAGGDIPLRNLRAALAKVRDQ